MLIRGILDCLFMNIVELCDLESRYIPSDASSEASSRRQFGLDILCAELARDQLHRSDLEYAGVL